MDACIHSGFFFENSWCLIPKVCFSSPNTLDFLNYLSDGIVSPDCLPVPIWTGSSLQKFSLQHCLQEQKSVVSQPPTKLLCEVLFFLTSRDCILRLPTPLLHDFPSRAQITSSWWQEEYRQPQTSRGAYKAILVLSRNLPGTKDHRDPTGFWDRCWATCTAHFQGLEASVPTGAC